MDAFSYLSVLLSILIGLAITQVLQGYRVLLLARGRVRFYAPPILWSVLILLSSAQSWWASYGLATHHQWDFGAFGIILLQFTFLYLMSGLVLPDVPSGEGVDLRDHYYRECRPFFATLIAMLACSVLKDWWLDGHLPETRNLIFHAVMAGTAVAAMVVRRPLYHEIIAPGALVGIGLYVATLFSRLAG